MTVSDRMTGAALITAKAHVKDVCDLGGTFTLIKPGTTDEFGHVLTESKLVLKSHPTRFTPHSREVKESISWAETVDVIFYTDTLSIDNLTLTIDDLKQYTKVRFEDQEYELEHIERYSSFGDDSLYIIIGGKK